MRLLRAPFTYRLWRPRHLAYVARDLWRPASRPEQPDRIHLEAVLGWLMRAQDRCDTTAGAGGVSAGWSFEDGWLPAYPETSGYTVESFLAASGMLSRPELRERARRIILWELSIQHEDGAFPGHFGEPGSRPVIFNTGQIMHGLVTAHDHLEIPGALEAAVRAGRWLLASQDADGCWRRNTHGGIPHVYNTRSAWALLRVGLASGTEALIQGALDNLAWALTRQTQSGWFADNAFAPDRSPYTHTIAYALRGFLEAGIMSGQEPFVAAALTGARAVAGQQRANGWLAGAFDDGWIPKAHYACLTGVAQMCGIWTRAWHLTGEEPFRIAADRGIGFLKRNHIISGQQDPADGGIAGSLPFWGAYSRFEYPNWAAKFFADALMTRMAPLLIPDDPRRLGKPSPADGQPALQQADQGMG
ncbi:MAG: terpene cyclase/mutase family protein [Magnetococcales bacterium]|nr:terpene cyclase/mutase family protein [Magnetococcales bacterium]